MTISSVCLSIPTEVILEEFIKPPGPLALDTVRFLFVAEDLTLCCKSELVHVFVPFNLFDVGYGDFCDLIVDNTFEFPFGEVRSHAVLRLLVYYIRCEGGLGCRNLRPIISECLGDASIFIVLDRSHMLSNTFHYSGILEGI